MDVLFESSGFQRFSRTPSVFFCPNGRFQSVSEMFLLLVSREAVEAKENVQIQAESVTLASQLNSVELKVVMRF